MSLFNSLLAGLLDTLIASPSAGQYLRFNGTQWANATLSAVAGTVSMLFANTTAAANTSTGETTLMTYTLAGGSLAAAGDSVRITFAGIMAGANAKTVKLYFGGTSVVFVNAVTAAADWAGTFTVTRIDATHQAMMAWGGRGTAASRADCALPGETLSGDVVIKVTGQGGASNEVTQKMMLGEKLSAP